MQEESVFLGFPLKKNHQTVALSQAFTFHLWFKLLGKHQNRNVIIRVRGLWCKIGREIVIVFSFVYVVYLYCIKRILVQFFMVVETTMICQMVKQWNKNEHVKSAILRFGHVYDITVTSYVGCLYLFWYEWKEETHSYTMVPIRHIWGVHFSNSREGVVTIPPPW